MTDREINLRSALFLVIGILLLLSLVICVFVVGGESDLVPVDASVTKKEEVDDGSNRYKFTLTYDVDGHSHIYSYVDKDVNEVDDIIQIYYHSNNVTIVKREKTSKLIFICPLVGLIVCIIGIFELFRRNNHAPKVDYQTSVIGVVGDTRQLEIITDDSTVHQYEKSPEELAEPQVKVIKKDIEEDSVVFDNNFDEDVDDEDTSKKSDVVFDTNSVVKSSNEVSDARKMLEIVASNVERNVVIPVAPVVQHSIKKEEKEQVIHNNEKEEVREDKNIESNNQSRDMERDFDLVEKEEERKQTIGEDVLENDKVEGESLEHKGAENHNNEAFQQLMKKVNRIQEEEQQKAEALRAQGLDETQTIPVDDVGKMLDSADLMGVDAKIAQRELISKIEEVAKSKTGLREDEIKDMIKDALKEVISEAQEEKRPIKKATLEVKDEKKVLKEVVQKRVLPNYFYVSGTSLVYEELGKESQELDLKTVNNVVRTINSEDKVVKIVVASDEIKCILTNMKNIDLEQVANLLFNKMRMIDENFNEVIEHKEY